jgi:hypothetical protein
MSSSEFDERSVKVGALRGALTLFAAIVSLFGIVAGFVSKPVGIIMILVGIALLIWSITSSWKDTGVLKWINIAVKLLLILISIAGLVVLFTSPYS